MDNLFLQFEVRGQKIRRSDTHDLFSGSRNFVKAHFIFDNYWSGVTKYAQYTASGTTYTVEIVNGESIVPWEVLHAPNTFDVSVFGGDLITANIVKVYVEESGLRDGELPTEPTPGYFQSIVEEVKESESTAKYYKEAARVSAQQTDADRGAVEAAKQTVLEGLDGFTDSTLPGAIRAVADKAEEEIVRIESTGTSQIGLVTEQADRAEREADRAEGEADKSTSQASKSESYAIGGTGTRAGEDTDNSKYYSIISSQAMAAAEAAVENYPVIGENGNWWVWDVTAGAYADSGLAAQGPQGVQGIQGPQGIQGDGLEFAWDGTQLGVRVEGSTEYTYSELKGDTGNGISSVVLKSGDHSAGTSDVYTINFTDATSFDFSVYNGANGELVVDDIVNDLTTGGTAVPLSAEQGKVLKGLVDTNATDIDTNTQQITALGARQTVSESILARLDPYTLDPDVYGVEIDFESKTFTRIAGASGLTAGANFDSIAAFGGRRRCNLADNGTVNAYYGDPGYIEDGSNGQVMVEQPKFYYKVVPLKIEKNDEVEIASVKFDTGATSAGYITITLNGTEQNVAVAAGDDATVVATKVRNTSFAGWTTRGSDVTVVFTAIKVGVKSATIVNDASTGVTATITNTQYGYIGKGFKLRKARYYISMTKKAGFKVHPAFVQNGVEREKIYLSAFEGSLYDVSASAYILNDATAADFTVTNGDKLASRANAKPISGASQSLTRRNCGILAENRGVGWSQQYAATAACTQLLFTVEYASMNSQTAIGKGVVDKPSGEGNESEITGATTLLGNASGMAAGTNGLVSITYRGEENFWGNIWAWVDGLNIYNQSDLYVADNGFVDDSSAAPYKDAGITLAKSSGYVSAFGYNEEFDWLFFPSETSGDSALPVGDNFYQTTTLNAWRVALLGGDWYYSLSAGAFCWLVTYYAGSRTRYVGGRLVYAPPVA